MFIVVVVVFFIVVVVGFFLYIELNFKYVDSYNEHAIETEDLLTRNLTEYNDFVNFTPFTFNEQSVSKHFEIIIMHHFLIQTREIKYLEVNC